MNGKFGNFLNIIGNSERGGIFLKIPIKQWKDTVL